MALEKSLSQFCFSEFHEIFSKRSSCLHQINISLVYWPYLSWETREQKLWLIPTFFNFLQITYKLKNLNRQYFLILDTQWAKLCEALADYRSDFLDVAKNLDKCFSNGHISGETVYMQKLSELWSKRLLVWMMTVMSKNLDSDVVIGMYNDCYYNYYCCCCYKLLGIWGQFFI